MVAVGTGVTERVSVAHDEAQSPGFARSASISDDGMRVAFVANGTNLIPNGSGIQSIYVRDRGQANTERWGEGSDGGIGFAGSDDPSITADGEALAFFSLAALEPDDANNMHDIYLRSCGPTGTPFCFGGGGCPCGGNGGISSGCPNSVEAGGASLSASGIPSVFADSVLLEASGLPGNVSILFFQGTNALGGVAFGDGLRCAGGVTQRLGVRFASGGVAQYGVGGDVPVATRGMLPAIGGTRHYQGWYRDSMSFCTPAAFNLTNGLTIEWVP